jgi:hypothetical protein
MSCHGFFLVGHKAFGSLLITDATATANKGSFKKKKTSRLWFEMICSLKLMQEFRGV